MTTNQPERDEHSVTPPYPRRSPRKHRNSSKILPSSHKNTATASITPHSFETSNSPHDTPVPKRHPSTSPRAFPTTIERPPTPQNRGNPSFGSPSTVPPPPKVRPLHNRIAEKHKSRKKRHTIRAENAGVTARRLNEFWTPESEADSRHRLSDSLIQGPLFNSSNEVIGTDREYIPRTRNPSEITTEENTRKNAPTDGANDLGNPGPLVSAEENTPAQSYEDQKWGGLAWEEALIFGYNFISEHTDVVLRKVLKVWDKKISGSKTERVARAFLVYRLSLRCGDNPSEVFSRCLGEDSSLSDEGTGDTVAARSSSLFRDFQVWLDLKRVHVATLKPVPRDEDLMRTFRSQERNYWREREAEAEQRMHMAADGDLSRALQRATGVSSHTRRGTPVRAYSESLQSSEPITLSLFTRLCLILRDDEAARDALIASGQPLEREQQDRRVNRESFWEAIAERFNDPSLAPKLDLRGILENVDPSPAPRENVAASRLRTVWYNMRGPFSLSVRNYQKSGQNNPTLDGFLNFVDSAENGDLFAISKRKVVMFMVMGMGSDNPRHTDAELLNLTVKVIPYNAGFDEAGSSINGVVESEEGSRKRARMSTDTQELCDTFKGLIGEFRTFNGALAGMVGVRRQEGELNRGNEVAGISHVDAVQVMEHRARAVEVLRTAHKNYMVAKEEKGDENDPLVVIEKEHYELTREQYDATFRAGNPV